MKIHLLQPRDLRNNTSKKVIILFIGLLSSLHAISQQVAHIEGIHVYLVKNGVKLNKEKLAAFVHEEKLKRTWTNMNLSGTYRVDDMLLGIFDFQGNFKDVFAQLKGDQDKLCNRHKSNPYYKSILYHVRNYHVFIKSHEDGDFVIYWCGTLNDTHQLGVNFTLVCHKVDSDKAFETLNEMLSNLKFADNSQPKDTVNLK
jgi:hypothetical protein